MTKYKYLSKNERITIEEELNKGVSFKKIALRLSRNNSTISREVKNYSTVKRLGAIGLPFNNCANRHNCEEYRLCKKEDCIRQTCKGCKFCFRLCSNFKRENCEKLDSPPYVCNGCNKQKKMSFRKFIYIGHKVL